jgi:hypothetical protein
MLLLPLVLLGGFLPSASDAEPRAPRPALVSVLGDTPELRVTAVDNVPVARIPPRALLRDPNAATARAGVVGVWVTPGPHLVHSQFARNMPDGVNLSQGNVRLVAEAGHSYLIHPRVRTPRGKAAFEIVDLGVDYPQACLPGVLDNVALARSGRRFTRDELASCRRDARRR